MSCTSLDIKAPKNGVVAAGDEPRSPAAKAGQYAALGYNLVEQNVADKAVGFGALTNTAG